MQHFINLKGNPYEKMSFPYYSNPPIIKCSRRKHSIRPSGKSWNKNVFARNKKVTNFIIEDGNAGAHSLWDKENPNSGSFSTVIERDYSDGVLVSNITVTPAKNGKCSVEYQRIFNMDKPCIAVSQGFKNAKYRTELNKSVSVLEDGTTFMYLIPNGNQCTVIRKEYFVDGLKL